MERDFWILLVEDDEPVSLIEGDDAGWAGVRPLLRTSVFETGESVLPVFTSKAKALAFAPHAEEAAVPVRLTQEEIRQRVFDGDYQGHCVVDPAPDSPGREITVNDLHIV